MYVYVCICMYMSELNKQTQLYGGVWAYGSVYGRMVVCFCMCMGVWVCGGMGMCMGVCMYMSELNKQTQL